MTLTDLLARFADVETTADGWLVHCPAHPDSRQSLRLAVSDAGRVLLRCRAGCSTTAVLDALGMSMRDLATMEPGEAGNAPRVTSQDTPAGPAAIAALAADLDRWASDGDDGTRTAPAFEYAERRFGVDLAAFVRLGLGYADDLPGGPRLVVPFRDRDGVPRGYQARALAPEAQVRWLGPKNPEGASWTKVAYFEGASGWDEVLICEGPGDALTGAALGYDTIGIRGAGLSSDPKVAETVAEWVGDREAVIAGDGDPSGRRFSAALAEALAGLDVRVRVLNVPDDLDLTDWRKRDEHGFAREIIRAIAEAPRVKSRSAALLAWDEDRYSLTDLGGARYLRDYVESIGSGVRYSEEVGFYLLDSGVWRRDDQQGIRTHAQDVADLVKTIANNAAEIAAADGATKDDKQRAGRLKRYAQHAQTSRGLDAMLRELQAVQGVPANVNAFDKHDHLLACRNGVVDLRTGSLQPHDPSLLLTRRVDLDYSPEATCPRWEQFLEEVFPAHPDLPGYMQRLIGYGVTGQTDEQAFAVLWGTGANGKSVFTDTLTEVFRELTVTTPFSTFEERGSGGIPNDLAALKGARLVMAAEGEQGRPMAESVLKRVTGRDLIAARFMRKEFFEFRPTFLLLLATNFKPSFKGQDEGLWRRVKLIPFERYFRPDERDHRLPFDLLNESEGILAWAVAGARKWYAEGLHDPQVIRDSTSEYRATSDALAGFLPGVFVADPDAGRVSGKVLFDAYLQWADEENLPGRERWQRKTFFGALEERGLAKRQTKAGVAFDGVRRSRVTDREAEGADMAPLALSPTDENPALQGADLDAV